MPEGESARGVECWHGSIASALFRNGMVAAAVVECGRVRFCSLALVSLLGEVGLDAGNFLDHVAEADRERISSALESSLTRGVSEPIACCLVHADGHHIPVELRMAATDIGIDSATLVLVEDRTEREAVEQRLRAIAHYDALTGLPNRVLLQDRLMQGFAAAARNARLLGLLVIDLDGFKAVNDGFGHSSGDTILRETAGRLSECLRSVDTLARIGGDEFVVVLPELSRREDAAVIAARLVNALRRPFAIDRVDARIGASIGISLYPDDGAQIDMLFARADAAMYAAKHAGRNQYAFADGSATVVLAADRCEWSDEWRLGNHLMDTDHEALFGLLNDLGSVLANEADEFSVRVRLRRLVDFCAQHFANEERIMSDSRIDGLESHRSEHRRLLLDLSELAEHTHWVGASLTMRFLKNWLIGHMQSYDRATARALACIVTEGDHGADTA